MAVDACLGALLPHSLASEEHRAPSLEPKPGLQSSVYLWEAPLTKERVLPRKCGEVVTELTLQKAGPRAVMRVHWAVASHNKCWPNTTSETTLVHIC